MSDTSVMRVDESVRLQQAALAIRSREELVAFVRALADNLRRKPEEWENHDLPSYLEALAAWSEDMEGYCNNQGESLPEAPGWRTLGQMLLAAKVYE